MSGKRGYLARLLDVLEFVAEQSGAVTLTGVATGTDVPISTASRLMGLLTDRGYLRRESSGSYTLGPRMAHLGLRTVGHLRDTRRLEESTSELSALTGESVSAGLLIGPEIVLVARHEPAHPLRVVVRVGDIIAPHTSAMGKAVLANLPMDERREVIEAAVGADKADAVLAELAEELVEVFRDGYACDEQTYALGQRCRAAALLDYRGRAIGGLSIAGPAPRFTSDVARASLGELLAAVDRLATGSLAGGPVTGTQSHPSEGT